MFQAVFTHNTTFFPVLRPAADVGSIPRVDVVTVSAFRKRMVAELSYAQPYEDTEFGARHDLPGQRPGTESPRS